MQAHDKLKKKVTDRDSIIYYGRVYAQRNES